MKVVRESGVYAVIAPNMCKQIVALQSMLESMAEQFPLRRLLAPRRRVAPECQSRHERHRKGICVALEHSRGAMRPFSKTISSR